MVPSDNGGLSDCKLSSGRDKSERNEDTRLKFVPALSFLPFVNLFL